MGLLSWIIVGLIAGSLAGAATGAEKRGCLTTTVVGILGGVVGGALFNAAGEHGITDFGIWALFVAFVGACALLFLLQVFGVVGRRR
ncbi:MAG: GlsB/YeaQ/YmgE family stress response membrane protein [Acidimicrobiales bacterium]